jgi:small-conductance mechanosensitive channel
MIRKTILLWCLTFNLVGMAAALGQPDSQAASTRNQEVVTAPVMIDEFVLFHVRGIQAYPAARRARDIAARIKAIAADREIKTESITVAESAISSDIMAGKERIFGIYDADAAQEQIDRKVLAAVYLARTKQAIETYRRARESNRLLRAGLFGVLFSVIFAGVLLLLKVLYKKLLYLLESKSKRKIQDLQIQSQEIIRAERIWTILTTALRAMRLVLIIILAYVYLESVLSLFPWTRIIASKLAGYVLSPLRTLGRGFLDYLPNFIFIAIFVLVVRGLLKMIQLFFSGIEKKTIRFYNFDPEWAVPTYKLIRIAIIVFSVVILYPYIPGAQSAAFKGISIFLGVVLSLGSSTSISNIVAGYAMIYRRTFKIGDRVKIGEFMGDVTEMRLLVTHLRSIKNEELIVPNSLILGSSVLNYSSFALKKNLILHTNVTIGYDVPWRQVEALLENAAAQTADVLKKPKPFVLQVSLGDFYVDYELNAYTDKPNEMARIYSDLHKNILDAFNQAGVQIMSPHYEIDPAEAKIVPREHWYAPPAKREDKPDKPE